MVKVSTELNSHGEGPSGKALKQAEDYADKVEKHNIEQEAERLKEESELRQENEEFDLEEALDPKRVGMGQAGFARSNPVVSTQRRLFAKVLLRRARAYELLSDLDAAANDLRVVRRVEPDNQEARQRLAVMESALAPKPECAPPPSVPSVGGPGDEAGGGLAPPVVAHRKPEDLFKLSSTVAATASNAAATDNLDIRPVDKYGVPIEPEDADDAEEESFDHAATTSLLQSAAEYMRKNDYLGALQIYGYVRRRCKVWESPVVELKVLSNTSLCLQRLRGRLPELISACNEALQRIAELRREATSGVSEDMLLNMECAVLSRRGNAYSQQERHEESNRDAALVRELLGTPA
jgi:tetratricopeptide (TPR) repeat protein